MNEKKPIDIAEFNREMIAYVIQEINKINEKLNYLQQKIKKLNYEFYRGN